MTKAETIAERSRRQMGEVSGLAALCEPGTFLVAEDGYDWVQGTLADSGLRFEAKISSTARPGNLLSGRIRMISIWDDAVRKARQDYSAARLLAFDAPSWEVHPPAEFTPVLRRFFVALDDAAALARLDAGDPFMAAAMPRSAIVAVSQRGTGYVVAWGDDPVIGREVDAMSELVEDLGVPGVPVEPGLYRWTGTITHDGSEDGEPEWRGAFERIEVAEWLNAEAAKPAAPIRR